MVFLNKKREYVNEQRLNNYLSENTKFCNTSRHKLKSGGKADYFLDFDMLLINSTTLQIICEKISSKIEAILNSKTIHYFAYIVKKPGIGMIPLAGLFSTKFMKPNLFIYTAKKVLFEKIKLELDEQLLDGNKILLFTNHITTGTEILKAVEVIKAYKGSVTDILTYTFKEKEFDRTYFMKNNIDIHPIMIDPDDLPKSIKNKIRESQENGKEKEGL